MTPTDDGERRNGMNKRLLRLAACAALLLFGCATAQVSPDAVELPVDFAWQASDRCSGQSPAIQVHNIPAATKTLYVKLKDLDVPNWNHGGGTVAYDGSGLIPVGALQNGYNGPCPPSGSHRYQFTVKAIDAAGVIIGTGQQTRNFP
jgi:phosphatidylethanolamine-binding protein (PEBP) family uncharacterized protein